jgi:hypothetical protein
MSIRSLGASTLLRDCSCDLVIHIVAIILAGMTGKIHLVGMSCLYPAVADSTTTYYDLPTTENPQRWWPQCCVQV